MKNSAHAKKPVRMTENEWNEVIEELKEDNPVGKEDGFLAPKIEKVYKKEAAPGSLYKNSLNSRVYPTTNVTKVDKTGKYEEGESEMLRRFHQVRP